MKVVNRVIHHLGRPGYNIDSKISSRSLSVIILLRLSSLIRGLWHGLWMGNCAGFLFVGRHCTLLHRHKMYLGRTVTIGNSVKIDALCREGIIIGNSVSIHDNTIIDGTGVIRNIGEGIKIGNNVGISEGCHFQVRGSIEIGDDVLFGPNVTIISESHNFSDLIKSISAQGENRVGVKIGNRCWIGANATILDGVKIGKDCIVGAGSAVIKDVPDRAIVAGVPANIKKYRGD